MPAPIHTIRLRNFKAFYGEEEKIELNGKHLLMYGENGSGKSSIYWALYTLFQSATKRQDEIQKYFTPNHEEHLINSSHVIENSIPDENANLVPPQSIGLNAYVAVELEDTSMLRIDSRGIAPGTNHEILEEFNRKSDFISHRLLINFYNFRNSKRINLWEVFVRDVFPFTLNQNGNGTETLSQRLKAIETGKPFKLYDNGDFSLTRSQEWQNVYNQTIIEFNREVEYWINELNLKATELYNRFLKDHTDKELRIKLAYSEQLEFRKFTPHYYKQNELWYERWSNLCDLNEPEITLSIEEKNEFDGFSKIEKPQSHLNEAKLTSISLAVRFSLLDETIRTADRGKLLVLDDLLVSLDMSNRDKVINMILDEFAPKYKIQWFTHERNFFDFVLYKIRQRAVLKEWNIKEVFAPETVKCNPIIIDAGLSYFEKAEKYYETRDYTTCSIYLRKELERLITERIPDEFSKTVDGQYYNLAHYWKLFVERSKSLDNEVRQEVQDLFEQSKLLILNPQAHHSLDMPLYQMELKKAFELINTIKSDHPVSEMKLLLPRGTVLVFNHPTESYTFEFELKTDFVVNTLNGVRSERLPRCKVLTWVYNNDEYWDFQNQKISIPEREIVTDLNKMLGNLLKLPLQINSEMILQNTKVKHGIWSLGEISSKANVTLMITP